MGEPSPTDCGDYVIERRLGTGSYAIVWLGRRKRDGLVVALKAISRERLTEKLTENLESEMSILREFRHPNLVGLVEISKQPEHIFIALEFMRGGDLQKYIRREKRLEEKTAKRFMGHLASGLEFLWSKHLIHRDLKPQNLLLTSDEPTATLKIADFGFARKLEKASLAETLCGSPLYMAPEILSFKKYDAKADLWSVGTILFEMVAGEPPFGGRDHRELLNNIKRTQLRLPPHIQVSQDCLELLQQLLRRDPRARISLDDFARAPFVSNNVLMTPPILSEEGTSSEEDDDDDANTVTTVSHQIANYHHPKGRVASSSSSSGATLSPFVPGAAIVGRRSRGQEPQVAFGGAAPDLRFVPAPNVEQQLTATSSGEFVVVDHGRRRRRRKSFAVEFADEAVACAAALGRVGDEAVDRPLEALAVYMVALGLLRRATHAAENALNDARGERANALLVLAREQADVLVARADQARTAANDALCDDTRNSLVLSLSVSPSARRLARRPPRPAAAVVYSAAIASARRGVANESKGDHRAAADNYAQASRSLAALLFAFDLNDADKANILAVARGPVDRALHRVQPASLHHPEPSRDIPHAEYRNS